MSKAKFDPASVSALLGKGSEETAAGKIHQPKAAAPKKPAAKSNMNIRLTDDLLKALDEEQTRLRSLPGAKRGETTIGSVVEGLLRQALKLPPAKG